MVILNGWDRFCTLGKVPCTKETLLDFHEWCRVTGHPRVFRGLTGYQWTPRFLGVTQLILFYFLRENKIKKKTLNVTHNRKSKSMKTKSKSRGQVTYWEDTVKSCSTPFKPQKIGSLIIKLRQVCSTPLSP